MGFQTKCVRVEKQVLWVLITGAALRFNVKRRGTLEQCLGNHNWLARPRRGRVGLLGTKPRCFGLSHLDHVQCPRSSATVQFMAG
jgi:hypothetical protein